ncbi:MAG: hypothetical protein FWH52_02030 [Synergistaceae bacterium]|nr:hypothetical protein [Synergistaceae bacterium]
MANKGTKRVLLSATGAIIMTSCSVAPFVMVSHIWNNFWLNSKNNLIRIQQQIKYENAGH